MIFRNLRYKRVEKKYLAFLKSQDVLSEPFRNKIGQLKNYYIPISQMIFETFLKDNKTKIIGLTGGQGSGKSTISNILKIVLKEYFNLETVIFSIDDFYKTIKERKKLSKIISPLFLTRGVPGTHDTSMLLKVIQDLKKEKFNKVLIPKFNKANDDRFPKNKWLRVNKKPNIVIFEGWCVGVTPQKKKDLLTPINALEKHEDKKGIWRKKVNEELKKKYNDIFRQINKIIFLKVPSLKYVLKWRILQEKKLKLISKGKKTMSNNQIKKFVMFYERLTNHMLKTLPKKADTIIQVDKKHKLKNIKFN